MKLLQHIDKTINLLEDIKQSTEGLDSIPLNYYQQVYTTLIRLAQPLTQYIDPTISEPYIAFKNLSLEPLRSYFILEPKDDPNARKVLYLYANLINNALSDDIIQWLREYDDFACTVDRYCSYTDSSVCCAQCLANHSCFELNLGSMCNLVYHGDVLDIIECPYGKE